MSETEEALPANKLPMPEEPEGTLMPLGITAEAVRDQPRAITAALEQNRETIDKVADMVVRAATRGFGMAVGSGDSLRVAETARDAFGQIAGVFVRPENALTALSRKVSHTFGFFISSSGRQGDATEVLDFYAGSERPPQVLVSDSPHDSPYTAARPGDYLLRPGARAQEDPQPIPTRSTTVAQALMIDTALATAARNRFVGEREAAFWRNNILRKQVDWSGKSWMGQMLREAEAWAGSLREHMPVPQAATFYGNATDYTAAKMGDSLTAAAAQMPSAAHLLGEFNHALRIATVPPHQPVVILATEGITALHTEMFRAVEAEDRTPIMIGNFVGEEEAEDLRDDPRVFAVHGEPPPINILGAAFALQWLGLAFAARRVEAGYSRQQDVRAFSVKSLRRYAEYHQAERIKWRLGC